MLYILNREYSHLGKNLFDAEQICMKPKTTPREKQGHLLYPDLLKFLNPKHPLLVLAQKFPWAWFEKEFAQFYASVGRPGMPVRLMIGLLLLKQLESLSDERVVAAWIQNPYYQAFCGMEYFQWNQPCAASDLVHFRKRIGEEGMEKIFKASVELHGKAALEREVVIDTTVQEKNITFPTDTKLRVKAINRCWKLAAEEGITLRRSYRRELRKILRIIRFNKSRQDKDKVSAAILQVKKIANTLLQDVTRKLSEKSLSARHEELEICRRAVNQEQNDKNKIYSLHEPDVLCIAKGKEHKKYEFGAKAAIAMTKTNCIIVGVKSFSTNAYDGDTLKEVLPQIEKARGRVARTAYCDRGFRGRKRVGQTAIVLPEASRPDASPYAKRKARKNFGRRSAIEPVIGHLKKGFRLARNYLKGTIGDSINLLLAAAAFNIKKWLNALAQGLVFVLLLLCGLGRQKECETLS
jgi:IS5 family transposase